MDFISMKDFVLSKKKKTLFSHSAFNDLRSIKNYAKFLDTPFKLWMIEGFESNEEITNVQKPFLVCKSFDEDLSNEKRYSILELLPQMKTFKFTIESLYDTVYDFEITQHARDVFEF